MDIINVRGQLTLEDTCVQYTIYKEHFELLAQNEPRNDNELQHYLQLAEQLYDVLDTDKGTEDNSRQLRVVHEKTDGWPCCIVTIQLLAGQRDPRQLVCYWRSSSADFLPSDLGFLARVALEHDCDEIVCFAASLHVELMEHPDPPQVGRKVISRALNCAQCGKENLPYGGVHICTV